MDFKGLSDPVVIFNKPDKKPGIFQKIKPPGTDFFKSKKLLGGALTALLLFAVGLGVYLSQKPTQLIPQADDSLAELSIKPSIRTAVLNQEFESEVFLDTKDLTVSAIQVKITFDADKLQLLEVVPGNFFTTILTSPQNTTNSTFFAVGGDPKKGSGKVAVLKFKAISLTASGPVKIEFDQSETQAAAVGSGDQNVASGFFSSEVTISETTSPSPSYVPGICASTEQCPSGYYCPSPEPIPSGLAVDRVCVPITSPSPSPNAQGKGDGNNDIKIDLQDLSIMFSKWSPAIDIESHFQLDFDDNKRVNSFDYSQMKVLLIQLGLIRQ